MDNDENEDVYENKFVETEEQGLKSRGREVDGRIKKTPGTAKDVSGQGRTRNFIKLSLIIDDNL